MSSRLIIAVVVVVLAVGALIYSAATSTAKAVVTVHELMASGTSRENVRVGARVAPGTIEKKGGEPPEVSFSVRDISREEAKGEDSAGGTAAGTAGPLLPVRYRGLIPDTLKADRDVILEGNFDGREFVAKNLMTQCPSKYRPPSPEGGKAQPSSANSQ